MACNKYQGGVIYTIKTDNGGLYVGSTCNFAERKTTHKSRCFNEKCKEYNFKVYKNIRENGGKYTIEIYKKFPCNSEKELRMEEEESRKYLNANLNSQKAFRTKEDTKIQQSEYREKNKEQIKEYREKNKEQIKGYREKNKEQNKIKKAEYYEKNKEQLNIKKAEYYEKNKEQIRIKKAEIITCECGMQITKGNLLRHQKSNKHLKLMEEL